VIENLVTNAIKHTPSGGRVEIALRRGDRRMRVEVRDEGRGISAADRSRIFEKFGVLGGHNERGYHSAGLGLTFCKLAVEAHGGTIGVDAGEPRGSVFWFELPA
jgi:signal transduction histidine kinase